jgi:large subunit ribosomal protein L10
MSEESKEKKAKIIQNLKEAFSRCSVGILTDYRGLTTTEITALRRKLQGSGGEYRVVKNTLARFAAQEAGIDDLANYLEGPVAIALGYGAINEPARILSDYSRTSRIEIGIKAGFLTDKVLTADDVKRLATLPSREVLIAKVVGGIKSPLYALVSCLYGPLRGLQGVLQARIAQLEGE